MAAAQNLIARWLKQGDAVIVFSYSTRLLDLVEVSHRDLWWSSIALPRPNDLPPLSCRTCSVVVRLTFCGSTVPYRRKSGKAW